MVDRRGGQRGSRQGARVVLYWVGRYVGVRVRRCVSETVGRGRSKGSAFTMWKLTVWLGREEFWVSVSEGALAQPWC